MASNPLGVVETALEYDLFLEGSEIVFDGPTRFHTLALRDGRVLLVEAEIAG